MSPYCDLHGGYVLNATIDRYAYAVIRQLDEPAVRFIASDNQVLEQWDAARQIELDGGLDLHKAVYNHFLPHLGSFESAGLELTTFCDAPVGSGLGSSSTLVVAMIRAFIELSGLPIDDYMLAHLAYRVERIDCGLQGGRQDQYSATFGGFNFMEFRESGDVLVNPLRVRSEVICELEASLVLFFTGVSRESAKIIADQSKNITGGGAEALEAMHGLKREALQMKDSLLRGDFSGLVESMRMGWENKKRSARTVSNPHIDEIYDTAMSAGALAGKVSGAGGGGFMLFFVPNECRMNVIRALARFDGQISNCHFTKSGAQAWMI